MLTSTRRQILVLVAVLLIPTSGLEADSHTIFQILTSDKDLDWILKVANSRGRNISSDQGEGSTPTPRVIAVNDYVVVVYEVGTGLNYATILDSQGILRSVDNVLDFDGSVLATIDTEGTLVLSQIDGKILKREISPVPKRSFYANPIVEWTFGKGSFRYAVMQKGTKIEKMLTW